MCNSLPYNSIIFSLVYGGDLQYGWLREATAPRFPTARVDRKPEPRAGDRVNVEKLE